MNAIKHFRDLPFIEYTPRGCAPLVSITAPNIRDDGYISHREWEPLKSLQLKPVHVSEYEYTETQDGAYPSTEQYA